MAMAIGRTRNGNGTTDQNSLLCVICVIVLFLSHVRSLIPLNLLPIVIIMVFCKAPRLSVDHFLLLLLMG